MTVPDARQPHLTRHARSRSAGFTLVELLVVMGIIVIIAAVSVPAFRFITGSRSVDSGQNVINAMVGRARSAALVSGQTHGVFVFLDPRNDRTTLALVHQNNADSEYSGWSTTDTAGQTIDANGNGASAPAVVTYFDSSNADLDPSTALQMVSTSETVPGAPSSFVRVAALPFQCIQQHTSPGGKQVTSVSPYSNPYWNANASGLEIVRDTELQLLPQGIGVEVVIDPQNNVRASSGLGASRLGVNRYARTGVILFDGQGRFASIPYDVYAASHLGQALFLSHAGNGSYVSTTPQSLAGGSSPPLSAIPLYSGFGVVLYDRQAFLADAKVNAYTEYDYLFGDANNASDAHLPSGAGFGPDLPPGSQTPTAGADLLKQSWLDTNGTLLTATRYNGGMTKSE